MSEIGQAVAQVRITRAVSAAATTTLVGLFLTVGSCEVYERYTRHLETEQAIKAGWSAFEVQCLELSVSTERRLDVLRTECAQAVNGRKP